MGDRPDEVFQIENKHGIPKDHVRVEVGTRVITCRRRQRNPITERRHDLTKLSDDGYLKPFLALKSKLSQDTIDLRTTPILTFDKDRWDFEEKEGTVVITKREPESQYGEFLLDNE